MLHTEAFERLCRAEAAYAGKAVEDVVKERSTDRQPEYRRRESECAVNRDKVRDLRLKLEDNGIDY
jgi:hypothetical protein